MRAPLRVRSVPPSWIGWLTTFVVLIPSLGVDGTLFRVDPGCAYSHGRLRLRGGGSDEGALGDWSEIEKALEDSRRELKITVESEVSFSVAGLMCGDVWQIFLPHLLLQLCLVVCARVDGITEDARAQEEGKQLPDSLWQCYHLNRLEITGGKLKSLPEGSA